jgi:transposase
MTSTPLPSREDVRAAYRQGEEAVVALFDVLVAVIRALEMRVQALEDQLAKNSRNSGKPPSSDGVKKGRSQRRKGERRSGGQPGHTGHTLKMVEAPDHIERHAVSVCPHCLTDLQGFEPSLVEKRQVFDIPAVQLEVTEYQAEVKQCPRCGQSVKGGFPSGVTQPVQYGPRLKAQAVYLSVYQLMPLARTCEVFEDFYGHAPSQAWVLEALTDIVGPIGPVVEQIKQQIKAAPVVHFDESGVRVEGRLNWLHVAGTERLTHYTIHPKRGREGMQAAGILPDFQGRAMHDHWSPYMTFETCQHTFCNAHHLRELQFIVDQYQQSWAQDMIHLLRDSKATVEAAVSPDQPALSAERIIAYENCYVEILRQGFEVNPPPERLCLNQRGRKKQSPARNLLNRLHQYQAETLTFMRDFRVPFDNNLAERDIRMVKLKGKISGTFRSRLGADTFCTIRSYISTVRKQGGNVIQTTYDAFLGQPFTSLPLAGLPE